MVKLRRVESQLDLPFEDTSLDIDALPYFPESSSGKVILEYLESPDNFFLGNHDHWDSNGGKVRIKKGSKILETPVDMIRVDAKVIKGRDTKTYPRLHKVWLKTFSPKEVTFYLDKSVICDMYLYSQNKDFGIKLIPDQSGVIYVDYKGDHIEFRPNTIYFFLEKNESNKKKLLDFFNS